MEEWKDGRVEGWKSGRVGKFDNSTIRQWKSGKMEEWNFGKPKGKPQRGEILIELVDSMEFGGAAHRNIQASHSVAKCL